MKVKKWAFMVLVTAFLALLSVAAYAYPVPPTIRIGLESKYTNMQEVQIDNREILMGYGDRGSFVPCEVLTADERFSVARDDGYYVQLSAAYNNFEDATDAGIVAVTPNTDRPYVLCVGPYSQGEALSEAAASGGWVMGGNLVALKDGTRVIAVFDCATAAPQIMPSSGISVNLGDRRYRGILEFNRAANANLSVVNVATMEEYLYSVVPSEMPSGWEAEALKAQSVAARSYTLTRMGVHTGYDLCDAIHCQVYLGEGNESAAAKAAVDATSGQVACYGGRPINAVYSSGSGGHTDDSENVWTDTVPYLRGVDDSADTGSQEWTRTFSLSEINALLNINGENIGAATGIEITDVENGRVQELTVLGTQGKLVLDKESTRTFFSASKDGSLLSRNFAIANGTNAAAVEKPTQVAVYSERGLEQYQVGELSVFDPLSREAIPISNIAVVGDGTTANYAETTTTVSGGASTGDTIVLIGRGNGHGVGMGQFGAQGMAQAGADYIEILKHYYTGIEIE